MKRVLLTAPSLLLMLILTFVTAAQDDAARIWLSSTTQQAAAGEEVILTVNVSGAVGIYGSGFKLSYDPHALEVVQDGGEAVKIGGLFGDAPNFPLVNTAGDGIIEFAVTLVQPAEPISGEGVLGTVTFRALQDTPVVVTPVEVRLVAPEFMDVGGRKIAQTMNTIMPQVAAEIALSPGVAPDAVADVNTGAATASAVDTGAATVSVAASAAARQQAESSAVRSVPDAPAPAIMLQPVPQPENRPANSTMILAALLFLVGVGLLVVSVGLYTRMRTLNLLND